MKKFLFGFIFCFGIFGFGGISDGLAFSEGEKKFLEELKNTPGINLPKGFGSKCDDFYEAEKDWWNYWEYNGKVICDENENIKILNLNSVKLTKIPNHLFELKSLQLLDLSSNKITNIKSESFDQLESLETLYLSYNEIKEIEKNDFNGLINLQNLYLGGNKLTEIKKESFNKLKKLEWLDLFKNQINCIPIEINFIKEIYLNSISKPITEKDYCKNPIKTNNDSITTPFKGAYLISLMFLISL
jgi:hypothetical protein